MQAVEAVDPIDRTDLKEEATGTITVTTGGLMPLEEVALIKPVSCSLLL